MPDMDGIELLTRLKEAKIKIPRLVISANIQETVKEQCLSLGAAGFINKPFKEEEVNRFITRILEIKI
jgi:CheY-like chemotaxis protein